jgi:hypothetical protein
MLARLALLLFVLPAVAMAQAASATRAASPPAQAATAMPGAASPPTPAPAQSQLASAAPPADPAQCRIACAQTNYFCRAGEHPDDCGGGWSQCVSGCDLPDMIPDVSTAP